MKRVKMKENKIIQNEVKRSKRKRGNGPERKNGSRRVKSFLTGLLVFFIAFFGTASLIRVDAAAGGTAGSEAFFSSYFIRTGEREVQVKILGLKARIVNGIVVADD